MVRALALALIAAALVAAEQEAVLDPLAGLTPPDSERNWHCPVRAAAQIGQGNGGAFSHTDHWNRYAWDYSVAVGTPVVAARSGVVATVRTDSAIGGNDRRFLADANRIVIRHSDGTTALYLHLAKNRSLVRVGEFVLRGELIGYSGDSGFASGPHLHFTAADEDGISIAAQFSDFAHNDGVPATGDLHGPGAPPKVPQAAIEACKRMLRLARRAHDLDRPDIGLSVLAAPVSAKAIEGYYVARQLEAYRASFRARVQARIAVWNAAPADNLAVALATKQALLALTPVKEAKDLVEQLTARERSLPPAVAKAIASPALRDLVAAVKADCAEEVAVAGNTYIAAIRRGDAAKPLALAGLERLLLAFTARFQGDLRRLDDESARCLPAHRDSVRADGEATARLCLSLAGHWKTYFPSEANRADGLLGEAQAAWERIQANVGKR